VQRLNQTVSGRCCDLGFDPVTQPVDLGTLIIDLGLLQVDLLVGERDKVTMRDLWRRTPHLPSRCINTTLLSTVRPGRDYLDQAATGGETIRLATCLTYGYPVIWISSVVAFAATFART
jgi:hypothetical protein